MVSALSPKMYQAAKANGSALVQGEGTWAGIEGKGQMLIAKTKTGSFIAVDNAGNVQALEGATTKEEAAAKAKQIYVGGQSKLFDLADFSEVMKKILNNAANSVGNTTQGDENTAGDSTGKQDGTSVVTPTNPAGATGNSSQTQTTPKPETKNQTNKTQTPQTPASTPQKSESTNQTSTKTEGDDTGFADAQKSITGSNEALAESATGALSLSLR